jgi:hypothetical protein
MAPVYLYVCIDITTEFSTSAKCIQQRFITNSSPVGVDASHILKLIFQRIRYFTVSLYLILFLMKWFGNMCWKIKRFFGYEFV